MKIPPFNIGKEPMTVTITVTGERRHRFRIWALEKFLNAWGLIGWALRVRVHAVVELSH